MMRWTIEKVELANSVYNDIDIDDIAEPTYTPDEEELEISAETSDETEIEGLFKKSQTNRQIV